MEVSAENSLVIKNNDTVELNRIPVSAYADFYRHAIHLLTNKNNTHCVSYFGFRKGDVLKFICCIADDNEHTIHLLSHEMNAKEVHYPLPSISKYVYAIHIYEREIAENFGLDFEDHPWLKPVRYAHNRADKSKVINNYPFFKIESNELHEVGVGPIHAGVIEPGHFRFQCNGELVLHLEIQLGWQHRGVEHVFLEKKKLLQRHTLMECIAGDTAVGHNTAFSSLMENLSGSTLNKNLETERVIALELERIAMYVFDISNLCTGIAYQLGNSVFGALRTPLINYFQWWCGNRFGKSLVRVAGTNYPLTEELVKKFYELLNDVEWRFNEIAERTFNMPGVLKRFQDIGTITTKQAEMIGAVGMSARMAGVERDIRSSHPHGVYREMNHEPVILESGDVYARFLIRRIEVGRSINIIRHLLKDFIPASALKPLNDSNLKLQADSFSLSLIEGWRGEICHAAVTGERGEIIHYKVKDPSFHNWLALALSLRNLEISDFPINNKSYDLSYCGHDL